MGSPLVALHTQALSGPVAARYLELLERALRAGRTRASFPPRAQVTQTLRSLAAGLAQGVYEQIYMDARSGLPNLASVTRVATDWELAARGEGPGRAGPYGEALRAAAPLPVDASRATVRRLDPARGVAEVRFCLTKISGDGALDRVTVELVQRDGALVRELVKVDPDTASARAGDALRTTVYRLASYDAEAIFLRLHEQPGVTVTRVERGSIGPFLAALDAPGQEVTRPEEAPPTAVVALWADALGAGERPVVLELATDIAGLDVPEERSNDPLRPLLADGVGARARGEYRALRADHGFRVFKDRKFVASRDMVAPLRALCADAGTRNLIYRLPPQR